MYQVYGKLKLLRQEFTTSKKRAFRFICIETKTLRVKLDKVQEALELKSLT